MILQSVNLSRKDVSFLRLAAKIAEANGEGEFRHGAVIVNGGRVISVGWNKRRNSSIVMGEDSDYTDCMTHAEVDALSRANGSSKGAVMYVARVNDSGYTRFSAPCMNCVIALDKSGVKRVVFSV